MADNPCPECAAQGKAVTLKSPAGLGGHRFTVHGIRGQDRSSKRRRRQPRPPRPQRLAKANLYVQYLADHPGTHSITEMGAALGAEATRVGKSLSASKVRGYPIASDGHGNWHHIEAENLPVVAVQANPEPEPEPANGQVHFVSQQIVLLLRDSEGREWVAAPR
jgi:hypothetical protein